VAAVAVAEDDRLGQEPLGPQGLGGGEQVGGALGPQPVGQGHAAVTGRGVAQGSELVDDGVAEGVKRAGAGPVAGEAEHLMATGDELAGEWDADGAAGAGEQDLHGFRSWRRR
jgi:hypothetical protein